MSEEIRLLPDSGRDEGNGAKVSMIDRASELAIKSSLQGRNLTGRFGQGRFIPPYIQNLLPSRSLKIAYLPPPHGASRSSTSNSTPFDLSSR